jgi:hypothetical protein
MPPPSAICSIRHEMLFGKLNAGDRTGVAEEFAVWDEDRVNGG